MITVTRNKPLSAISEWCSVNLASDPAMSSDDATLTIYANLSAAELVQLQTALVDGSIGQHTWREIRAERDRLLAASDWTQNADSPLALSQREAWATYRQQLRDVPGMFARPDDVVWPDAPVTSAALEFAGMPVYSAMDVDRICQRQVYEAILPGQPETLQALALVSLLGDQSAAMLVIANPDATADELQAAQAVIAANVQIKAALDAIWSDGQIFKETVWNT